MKKMKLRLFLVAGFISFMPGIKINAASATDVYTSETRRNAIGTVGIIPYADSIITKYRTFKGRLQYRRWNVTRKCWVDPKWINLE